MKEKRIAVFLDRDGTINEEMGYINHPDRFKLLRGVGKAIKLLNDHKILVIVATNQSGVARGYFTEDLLKQVHQKMGKELSKYGAKIDKIYYCPHHPTEGSPPYRKRCACRKPGIGMLKKAKNDFDLDIKKCYVIGDRFKDVKWGHQVGAKSILVLTGYGKGEYIYQSHLWNDEPDYIAKNLYQAARWVIKNAGKNKK